MNPRRAGVVAKKMTPREVQKREMWVLLEPELDGIFQAIDRAREKGKPVLIHCVKGVWPIAAVVIAYLMNRYDVTYGSGS